MAPEAFGVIAVIGFGLSAVLAIVAAAYGVTHHRRHARGTQLRSGAGGSTRGSRGRAERKP